MKNFKIKYITFIYRDGVTLLSKDGKELERNQLVGGFFSALGCSTGILKKLQLIPENCEEIKLWFDTTYCIVKKRPLYTFVAFIDIEKDNEQNKNELNSVLKEIMGKFEEKYESILLEWDRNLSDFNKFGAIIDSIINK